MIVHLVLAAASVHAYEESRKLPQCASVLAARHGIEITREASGCFRVTCSELEDDDPHEGEQDAESAAPVLAMVEDYVLFLRNGYLEVVTDERLWLDMKHVSGLTVSSKPSAVHPY